MASDIYVISQEGRLLRLTNEARALLINQEDRRLRLTAE